MFQFSVFVIIFVFFYHKTSVFWFGNFKAMYFGPLLTFYIPSFHYFKTYFNTTYLFISFTRMCVANGIKKHWINQKWSPTMEVWMFPLPFWLQFKKSTNNMKFLFSPCMSSNYIATKTEKKRRRRLRIPIGPLFLHIIPLSLARPWQWKWKPSYAYIAHWK